MWKLPYQTDYDYTIEKGKTKSFCPMGYPQSL
jgi:hypothetical protein